MPANGTEYSVFDFNISLTVPSNVSISFNAKNAYSTTSIGGGWAWYAIIYVDGTLNNITGGSGFGTDCISLSGAANNLAVGSHEIKITWSGHSGMTLTNAAANTLVTMR